MITIDARGLICPAPVLETRKAIKTLPQSGGIVQVLVDNALAAENLERMSHAAGYQVMQADQGDKTYLLTITVGEYTPVEGTVSSIPPSSHRPEAAPSFVVAIGSNEMGHGDTELGEILIKGLLYTLSGLDTPPKTLLLFNSGAKLADANANTLADLQTLAENGVRIRVCGSCVNYYDIDLGIGEIANMLDLVEEMQGAGRLISL